MSLLDLNTIKKGRVDKEVRQMEFDAGNNEEYKVEAIQDIAVHANKSKSGHLPGLY